MKLPVGAIGVRLKKVKTKNEFAGGKEKLKERRLCLTNERVV